MSYNGILLSIHYNVDGDYLFIIHFIFWRCEYSHLLFICFQIEHEKKRLLSISSLFLTHADGFEPTSLKLMRL